MIINKQQYSGVKWPFPEQRKCGRWFFKIFTQHALIRGIMKLCNDTKIGNTRVFLSNKRETSVTNSGVLEHERINANFLLMK
jgi:hypothetical protein